MKPMLVSIWLMLCVNAAGVWRLGEDPSGTKYWVVVLVIVLSGFFMLLGMSGRD